MWGFRSKSHHSRSVSDQVKCPKWYQVGNVLLRARYLQVLFSDSFVVIGAMLTSINLITIRDYWIHLSVMFISFVLDCWLVPVLPRILCKSGILTTDLPHTVKSPHAPILVSAEKVRHGAPSCQDLGNNFVTGVPCPGDILSLRDPIPSAGHQLRVACQSKPGCNIRPGQWHHWIIQSLGKTSSISCKLWYQYCPEGESWPRAQ